MNFLKLNLITLFYTFLVYTHANYISLEVSLSVSTINTYSNYTFTFHRSIGVYNNFITNVQAVPLNTTITLIFPKTTYTNLSNGNYNCFF